MSEKEIIKIIDDFLYEHEFYLSFIDEEKEKKQYLAIQGLLDLYQQEKEKNKELEGENTKLSEEIIENICKNVEAEVFEEMRLELKQEKEKNKNLIKQLQEQNTEIQDTRHFKTIKRKRTRRYKN